MGASRRAVRLARGGGPEVGEDLVGDRRLVDTGDDAHRAVAGRARQRVHHKDLLEERRPPAGGLRRRQLRRGNPHGWPVRRGWRRPVAHAPRAIRVPAIEPRGDVALDKSEIGILWCKKEYIPPLLSGMPMRPATTRVLLSAAAIGTITACERPVSVSHEPTVTELAAVTTVRRIDARTAEVTGEHVQQSRIHATWNGQELVQVQLPAARAKPLLSGDGGISTFVSLGPLAISEFDPRAQMTSAMPLALPGGATTGTAIWTTFEVGPATNLAILDSSGVGLSQEYLWEYQSGVWHSRGWRLRVRDVDGSIVESIVGLSGGHVVHAGQPFTPQLFAACGLAATAGVIALARTLLPREAHAQAQYSGNDCWKYTRVGFNEVYSFPSQNSECANYSLNSALKFAAPVFGITDAAVAGVGITAILTGSQTITAAWGAIIVASPAVLGGALATATAAVTAIAAVSYFACSCHHQLLRAQCRAGGGGSGGSPPVPGPMAPAIGFSHNYVRGMVDAFWGIAPKN